MLLTSQASTTSPVVDATMLRAMEKDQPQRAASASASELPALGVVLHEGPFDRYWLGTTTDHSEVLPCDPDWLATFSMAQRQPAAY